MPIITSAKKRVRVTRKATVRNARTKRSLKTALKAFNAKPGTNAQRKAQSTLDIAVKKGVMHPNKAARKKRQLAAVAKAAGVKSGVKAEGKKPTAKAASKPAAKKPVAKKPATKKTAKK
ncbi:MAG TPA: 30S ribosomal protein S20 [Patescibacteria group bacterium]|nr:30S ribosomal protein S20 [Patescibacteria group bacterium]